MKLTISRVVSVVSAVSAVSVVSVMCVVSVVNGAFSECIGVAVLSQYPADPPDRSCSQASGPLFWTYSGRAVRESQPKVAWAGSQWVGNGALGL